MHACRRKMVKVSKKSSSSAAKVVAGVPTPPVRSSAAEKGTKLRRSLEKKNKKIVKLEKQIVKLRKELLDSQDAKRDALEARASEAENKVQDYTSKLENAEKSALTAKKSKDSKPKQKCEDIYVGPKAETPAKKLLVSSKKSAPTAKKSKRKQKSSSDDSPSEDMSEDQEDTEVGDYDPSVHGIHYFQSFQEERCLPQDSKTLYATDIDIQEDRMLSEDDFVKFFSDVGKVVKVEIHLDPKFDDVLEFAKIEFETHDVAKKAMEEKDSCLFYNCGPISLDGLPRAKDPGYVREDFTDKRQVIYVTGFSKKTILGDKLESKLRDRFSVCGEIHWITTPIDDNDFSEGYAFIEFKNEESLQKALRLEGTFFLGYPLKVGRSKVFVSSF